MKGEITSKKKLFKVKKNNVTPRTRELCLYFVCTDFEKVFVR